MADVPIDCDFPVWGLMPKKETGVVSFLNKYPEYDGRGTVIAILDSGVDPAAEGLKVTSTGETKVIERFDCSGCGDVNTSTVVKKVVDGCVTGLTGRKLKIPETWKNPSGEWRIGIVHAFSLYPTKVKERIQEHRKEHIWEVGHKPAFAEANKQLQDFENDVASKNSTLTTEEKLLKEELEARVDVLQAAEKKYTDLGPTYDCVLFHDGEVWRACIDTSECGELSSGPLLGEYSVTHEHSHLTPLDEMTISVNVHDAGDTLEVVGMCSTHGTHVAAIASGYFADEPARNGVAPGAKIVSLTIGDGRLGSMETGTALVRACIKVMELSSRMRVDVINMSYGEHAHWANAGRIGDIMRTVVQRYGVAWVVSGGNHGPALCTVGAPPDIAHPVLIGVGAFVSCEMSRSAYSLRRGVRAGPFSWSSRGPAADGALALSLCAPGGAVAPVARFTLRNCQLMNGTSMAAPHVAGALGVLISGLKAKSLPYSPFSLKRALENSATVLPQAEPWAQGCGLLNVEKAFDLLTTYHEQPERDVSFIIQCGASNGKGILLRPRPGDGPKEVSISVEPQFLQDHEDMHNKSVIPRQIEFGLRVTLTCDASWVSTPTHLDMMNAARPFSVKIDTSVLPPGAHFASINAYDVSCVSKGPVFRIPVTVLQAPPSPAPPPAHHPAPPALRVQADTFHSSDIRRHFIIPPAEATWGVLRISTEDKETVGRFLLHSMQLLPRRSCRSHELQKMVSITADAPTLLHFPVVGNVTLEIVLAKYWANIGSMVVDYSVEFHGLRPDFGPALAMFAGDGVRAVMLTSLRQQEVQPTAQLKYSEPVYRPSETKLTPLTSRDVIPPSRQIYQLVNTYNFHIAKATDVSPIVSLLCDMLYESEFESQMWMLYNSSKQLMAVGDAYPSKYSVKLEKGDYVLRLNVRHESRALLDKLQELPVVIQQRLQQPITLDAYCSRAQALIGGKKFTTATLSSGDMMPIYFTTVPSDKVSRSGLSVGHALSGSVWFCKEEAARRACSAALVFAPCEAPRRQPPRERRSDDYRDALQDFSISWLAKLEGEKLEQVYEELIEKFPGCLGAHVAYLQALDSPTDPKKLPHANEEPDVTTAWCEQLIAIADKVIKAIDQDKLLAYLGMKNDTRSDASKIKQEHEKQRGHLVEALCRRGAALCRLHALAHAPGAAPAGGAAPAAAPGAAPAGGAAPASPRDKLAAALHDNMNDLLKYIDITDAKVINYGVWHCFTLKQWGRAIKLLNKILEDRPSRDVEERLVQAYDQVGWHHLARATDLALPIKYPATYRPF